MTEKDASRRRPEGGLPHGEHPYDYGYERRQEIEEAYAHCVDNDRWPEGFVPFNAIRDLLAEVRAYQRSVVAHHDIANLSSEAIRESIGGSCQICARAQKHHS